jgi:hypothetical protein
MKFEGMNDLDKYKQI